MTTEGIEAVYLATHNWGKATKFFQALGFELEFDVAEGSGLLRAPHGPYVVVVEVPEHRPTGMQIVLKAAADLAVDADSPFEVVSPFEETHFGAMEMTVRDPDGRLWSLQAGEESPAGVDHG